MIFHEVVVFVHLNTLRLPVVLLKKIIDYFSKFHTAKEDMMRFTSYTPLAFPLMQNDRVQALTVISEARLYCNVVDEISDSKTISVASKF